MIERKKQHIANEIPGALRYKGNNEGPSVIEVYTYNQNECKVFKPNNLSQIEKFENTVWLNLCGLQNVELLRILGEKYNIHKIDLEDILNISQRGKIEKKDDYLISTLKMVYLDEDQIIHEQISIILTDTILITFQDTPYDVLNPVRRRIEKAEGQIRNMKLDYLYFSLLDCIVDEYFVVADFIEKRFAVAEEEVIEDDKNRPNQVYELRKELIFLKNDISPIKDSLAKFLRQDAIGFSEPVKPYLNDVLENMSQAIDLINTYREMANSLYEMQIERSSRNTSKTMMTLTVFSAIFIPLSFFAGVFGMNFKSLPGLDARNSFFWFLLVCIIVVILMLSFFKKKKWF